MRWRALSWHIKTLQVSREKKTLLIVQNTIDVKNFIYDVYNFNVAPDWTYQQHKKSCQIYAVKIIYLRVKKKHRTSLSCCISTWEKQVDIICHLRHTFSAAAAVTPARYWSNQCKKVKNGEKINNLYVCVVSFIQQPNSPT